MKVYCKNCKHSYTDYCYVKLCTKSKEVTIPGNFWEPTYKVSISNILCADRNQNNNCKHFEPKDK